MNKGKGIFTCIHCGQKHMRYVEKCPETQEPLSPSHKLEGVLLADRYKLGGIIGEGGMGIVYKGVHEKLGSKIAVKFLRTDIKYSEETLQRFQNEAKIAASVGHKNIVRIFDMGTYESTPYFVMEFLEGEPLDEIIEDKGTLAVAQAVDIAIPILEALNAVHFMGIIHRDLKPENIIICPQPGGGELVKILDFGICRLQTDAVSAMRITKTGAVFGTPYYMSPEQAEGRRDIDPRADLYSVGAILYKMLTGRTPFVGENYNTVIVNIINQEPPPPRKWNMEIPRDLEEIVMRSLARRRDDRYLDAVEFIEALEDFSSIPVRRERRSSALSDVGEKKEPVPDDIWDEEISVVVDNESALPTLRAELADTELGRKILKKEPKKPYGKRKRTFSWDSTAARVKGAIAKREMVWLMPVGIFLSVVAIAAVVGGIFALFNINRIAGGINHEQARATEAASPLKSVPLPTEAKTDKPQSEVVTKVEESSIEMIDEPVHFIGFTGLPEGATIFVDGSEATQVPVPVKAKEGTFHILIEADGYEPFIEHVDVRGDTVLHVNMKAASKKPKKKIQKGIDIISPPIDTKYPGKKHKKK